MSWETLKDKYHGQTCIIIGNGPSLRKIPRAFLEKYPTFGTNKIFLLDGFTPTYYAAVNPLVIEQNEARITEIRNDGVFLAAHAGIEGEGVYPLYSAGIPTFSRNPDKWIYEGFTVTYVCMQLAYYMGFNVCLLVGVDHSYRYEGKPNQEVVASGPDPNHFHPDYFNDGVRWHNPDLKRSEQAYRMAKTVFEADGRRIINLTPGSKLDVFEKGAVKEW